MNRERRRRRIREDHEVDVKKMEEWIHDENRSKRDQASIP